MILLNSMKKCLKLCVQVVKCWPQIWFSLFIFLLIFSTASQQRCFSISLVDFCYLFTFWPTSVTRWFSANWVQCPHFATKYLHFLLFWHLSKITMAQNRNGFNCSAKVCRTFLFHNLASIYIAWCTCVVAKLSFG